MLPAAGRRSGTGNYPDPAGRRVDSVEGNADLHPSIVAACRDTNIGQLADVRGTAPAAR